MPKTNANADAGGSAIVLPELCSGELKNYPSIIIKYSSYLELCNLYKNDGMTFCYKTLSIQAYAALIKLE